MKDRGYLRYLETYEGKYALGGNDFAYVRLHRKRQCLVWQQFWGGGGPEIEYTMEERAFMTNQPGDDGEEDEKGVFYLDEGIAGDWAEHIAHGPAKHVFQGQNPPVSLTHSYAGGLKWKRTDLPQQLPLFGDFGESALRIDVLQEAANIICGPRGDPNDCRMNLFDGRLDTKFNHNGGDWGERGQFFKGEAWVSLELFTPRSLAEYMIRTADDCPYRDPSDWTLLGSDDGTSWTTLDTRRGHVWPRTRFHGNVFTPDFETSEEAGRRFRFFKLHITATASMPSESVQISELVLVSNDVLTEQQRQENKQRKATSKKNPKR